MCSRAPHDGLNIQLAITGGMCPSLTPSQAKETGRLTGQSGHSLDLRRVRLPQELTAGGERWDPNQVRVPPDG